VKFKRETCCTKKYFAWYFKNKKGKAETLPFLFKLDIKNG
jgi:hypothetical protein